MSLAFHGHWAPYEKVWEREKKELISSCPGYQLSPGFLITTSLAVSFSLQHRHCTTLNQTFNEQYSLLRCEAPSHFDDNTIMISFWAVSTLKLSHLKLYNRMLNSIAADGKTSSKGMESYCRRNFTDAQSSEKQLETIFVFLQRLRFSNLIGSTRFWNRTGLFRYFLLLFDVSGSFRKGIFSPVKL